MSPSYERLQSTSGTTSVRIHCSAASSLAGSLPESLVASGSRPAGQPGGSTVERQHPLGTGNGISAREAEQIKKLITDLTSTVEFWTPTLRLSVLTWIAARVRIAATSWSPLEPPGPSFFYRTYSPAR